MSTQRRRTAGIRLTGPANVHVDPGPGALVYSIYAGLTPLRLDGVVVTHSHPDHYTDAEVLVEAMTQGTAKRKGVLAGPLSVLTGNGEVDPALSRYHQRLPGKVETLKPGAVFNVKGVSFTATKSIHGDPDGVGLVFESPSSGRVGYTSDTEYTPEIADAYKGCRLLLLCTVWPRGGRLEGHLSTDDALRFIQEAEPRCVVTTHYGLRMLNSDPSRDAAWLQSETGTPTVSAVDGLTVTLGEKILVQGPRKTDKPLQIAA